MSFEVIYFLACFLQGTLSVVNIIAFIPQWMKLFNSKSIDGVSISSWLIWLNSSIISLFYACMQYAKTDSGSALIVTTFISTICNLITIVLILNVQNKFEFRLNKISLMSLIFKL